MANTSVEPTHRALGLTDDEYEEIRERLGRDPNHLELAMYSVMWSEHCSYKSSRIHLKRFPSTAPQVLVGPGEGAGVLDVGDGIAVAIRIESHNHPSAIEPYQGAATGVGGILRDIFSMGARPIAIMDPLRFGPLEDPRSRWIAEGVVSGISGYGNSVGVPTVGGETVFDPTYSGNPLVNVLCLGVMPTERLVLGRAEGVGNLAVLLGSSTGREGIGGVSVLASAGFSDSEADAEKRPSVQVGDPFEEKRLIEACLELLSEELAVGVQDLGGAGITCATSETAAKGGAGMDVYVDAIPTREPAMEPFEVMTSESQERMLAIVEPSNLDAVLGIARRWEVNASVVGVVTDTGQLRVLDGPGPQLGDTDSGAAGGATGNATVLADVPAVSLENEAPLYDRERREPEDLEHRRAQSPDDIECADPAADLLSMLADTSWVWSQYDHMLFLNTVTPPGADASVLRLKHPDTGVDTGRGLALTTDGNHLWCAVDPRAGAAATLVESFMNLAVLGARPIAMVNCLNFGNPEHPEVMWQLSESVDGFGEALEAFEVPCVGGNVSLYNESLGTDIDPTPVAGVLGVVDRLERPAPGPQLETDAELLLVGSPATGGDALSGSTWAATHGGRGLGQFPVVDLPAARRCAAAVRSAVLGEVAPQGSVVGAHDVASGGLAVALAEMAVTSGIGVRVGEVGGHHELFSETPGRAVLCVGSEHVGALEAHFAAADVPVRRIGRAGGDRLVLGDLVDLSLQAVVESHRGALPDALAGGTTQG
ncbi:MAG: phosphoribosylformylglycinamidine synthase subunit PurL [Microthrixaceae bacterium]|nr:phosphoribosylformylglycinamidine synthase subunit PurL [Microthrixaceae bacterium]